MQKMCLFLVIILRKKSELNISLLLYSTYLLLYLFSSTEMYAIAVWKAAAPRKQLIRLFGCCKAGGENGDFLRLVLACFISDSNET